MAKKPLIERFLRDLSGKMKENIAPCNNEGSGWLKNKILLRI